MGAPSDENTGRIFSPQIISNHCEFSGKRSHAEKILPRLERAVVLKPEALEAPETVLRCTRANPGEGVFELGVVLPAQAGKLAARSSECVRMTTGNAGSEPRVDR